MASYCMWGTSIHNAGMMGADMMVMKKEESVTAGSIWVAKDYFSDDFDMPELDEQQVRFCLTYSLLVDCTCGDASLSIISGQDGVICCMYTSSIQRLPHVLFFA